MKYNLNTKANILNQLIEKGGIYGYAAKLYFNNEVQSKELIFECYSQCHVLQAKERWGENLINEIVTFCELHDEKIKKPNFILNASQLSTPFRSCTDANALRQI